MTDKNYSREDYVDAEENFCEKTSIVDEPEEVESEIEQIEPEVKSEIEQIESLSHSILDGAKSYNTLRKRKTKGCRSSLGQSNGFVNSPCSQNCVSDIGKDDMQKENESSGETEHEGGTIIEADPVVEVEEEKEDPSSSSDKHETITDCKTSSTSRESENFLFWLAGLVIQAVRFQVGIMVYVLSMPIYLMRQGYYFAMEPVSSISSLKEKLSSVCLPLIDTVLKGPSHLQSDPIWRSARIVGWGFFLSSYVFSILIMLILAAFGLGFIFMSNFVEEPVQMKKPLYFDYTRPHPVAFLPLQSCYSITNLEENSIKDGAKVNVLPRLIPPNHRLEVAIELTLPESDYNRNLGIFQVKLEFLTAEGNVMATSSHPCMLRFKSFPIRFAETLLLSASLLTGLSSESQMLHLDMIEFTEKWIPTACLRVTLERRAEFPPGVGIPEIYRAELYLSSELPWLQRMIWKWKWTLFIWVGLVFFTLEVLVLLCCCRPIIFPMVRGR